MKTRIAAVAAAFIALSVPATSALAYGPRGSVDFVLPASPYDGLTTGSLGVHYGPFYDRCVASSASEGNANQQTRPVKQYGQTSGGYRC
ncbi:hypothetical protein [Methylobacterium trifolii]|uniref:Uncharacterized protein n=1 Tax=Methylobacterium trifolii TaxID=1003092 RepID=A0ABQ4U106_9HYPH|nr:hypothetical protein [Methylobacterium trifolii]GJE59525.1 hypothetical protein MPOCJGCO_1618 [Methylobacterium trifolii]